MIEPYKSVRDSEEGSRHALRSLHRRCQAEAGLVSVVIPCYNQAHFLNEAIESVLAQSHPHFEIVVVDDGSTDNTSEVATGYPGVRCIRQDNQGVNAARNRGLAESKGSYVVFLDADDRLLPDALKAGLECFETHPECAFVSGHADIIAACGASRWRPQTPSAGGDLFLTLLSRKYWVNPGAVMYRRAVFESVGDFDPSICASEDYELYFRILRKFSHYWHDKVVLEHRRHDTNATLNAELMLAGTVTVLRSQWAHIKGCKQYIEAYEAGMRKGRLEYGVPLAEQIQARVRKREWRRAAQGMLVMLRYHPRGFALFLPSWESKPFSKTTDKLRVARKRNRKLKSALKEERKKVQQLEEQNKRLMLRTRNLEQQLQDV